MIHLNRSRKSVDISTFFRVQDDSNILNTHCTILNSVKIGRYFLSILTVETMAVISYNIDS